MRGEILSPFLLFYSVKHLEKRTDIHQVRSHSFCESISRNSGGFADAREEIKRALGRKHYAVSIGWSPMGP